jgi:predicted transposase YdaD
MLDIAKCKEILETHFANVTREEFIANLEEYCPELFEAGSNQIHVDNVKKSELYQQAKEENKLEIAPRLLQKGLSVEEVAELLELDVQLLAG